MLYYVNIYHYSLSTTVISLVAIAINTYLLYLLGGDFNTLTMNTNTLVNTIAIMFLLNSEVNVYNIVDCIITILQLLLKEYQLSHLSYRHHIVKHSMQT